MSSVSELLAFDAAENPDDWDAEELSASDEADAASADAPAVVPNLSTAMAADDALYSGLDGGGDDDLYAGLDGAPQLPSVLELRRSLDEATAERRALEEEEAELRQRFESGKAVVKDLLHRACQLLVTARHELERKDAMIERERKDAARAARGGQRGGRGGGADARQRGRSGSPPQSRRRS